MSDKEQADFLADYGEYVKDLERTYAELVRWVRKMTALAKAAREEEK